MRKFIFSPDTGCMAYNLLSEVCRMIGEIISHEGWFTGNAVNCVLAVLRCGRCGKLVGSLNANTLFVWRQQIPAKSKIGIACGE